MENENPIINPSNEISASSAEKAPAEATAAVKRHLFNKNHLFLGLAVLAVIIAGVLLVGKTSFSNMLPSLNPFNASAEAVAQKSIDYLNENMLAEGQTASVGGVSKESGIIKINVVIGDKNYDSYVTADGKLFFPEGFNIETPPVAK